MMMMGFGVMKIILLLSLLLIIIMVSCCEARNPIVIEAHGGGGEEDKEQVCEMCEKYVSVAINYLEDDHNQDSLVESLHLTCSHIPSPPLKQQCLSMVDHYTLLLFTQLSLINSSQICKSLNLCQSLMPLSSSSQGNCDACRNTVSQVVTKLKDPETKLKIIRLLLKECKSLNNYQDKCKKMVFEYGPLMLTDLEKFLDKKDVCSIIGVCPPPHSHEALSDS